MGKKAAAASAAATVVAADEDPSTVAEAVKKADAAMDALVVGCTIQTPYLIVLNEFLIQDEAQEDKRINA